MEKKYIEKVNKELEEFNSRKLKKSILSAGLTQKDANNIIGEVLKNSKDYFSTNAIHKATYKEILKYSSLFAANYNIKRSIYNLGPTGYPFEILCAELLKAKGYKTKVSVIKRGEFVKHEVDVVALREDQNLYCECKFHNQKFYKNDIKIPLYVYARFLDIKKANPSDEFEFVLISNTHFSDDAIKYSKGVGMHLYSLNYPKKDTFCDIIKKYKVYPITVLKSLKMKDKKELLAKGIVVIKQVSKSPLESLGLSSLKQDKIFQEIKVLTRPN